MNNRLILRTCLILLLIIVSGNLARAQVPAYFKKFSPEEIEKARAVVEAHPDSIVAHRKYMYTLSYNIALLAPQYNLWMKKYPENVNFPLGIGTIYSNAEMPEAKDFLLKAAKMKPKNPEIWLMLADDASRWGQKDLSAEYLRKAALADTSNAEYAFYYVWSFRNGNQVEYQQKVDDFIKRFPARNEGAEALYWLGEDALNQNDKINYFEKLRQLYSPQKFQSSAYGMVGLADVYMQTDPEKALSLASDMGEEKDWKLRKKAAESLIKINQLEKNQDYKNALIELNQIRLPEFNYLNDYMVLKKSSLQDKAGDVKSAYDSVAVAFAKLPTDQLSTALEVYAKKIGKDSGRVAKDIETIRYNSAKAAYPFDLSLYTSNKKLNLNDLKGKVVLLTFWFPGCGPCGEEFPYFQSVINKFKGKDVEYVGINVFPEQDSYVLSFLKNTKYSFIPLRGSREFAATSYAVRGEPTNFLIDKNGKIVFKNFHIDNSNHRTLELMISSLLEKGGQSN